jgi:hypothetical protein
MRFYLVRMPGWIVEKVADFPSLEDAEEAMLKGMVPDNWRELARRHEYCGRHHILDPEELWDLMSTDLIRDPELLGVIDVMEDFTEGECRALHNHARGHPDDKESEVIRAIRAQSQPTAHQQQKVTQPGSNRTPLNVEPGPTVRR